MKHSRTLTKTVVAAAMALVSLAVLPTAASALDERTDEQIEALDRWCRSKGGIVVDDVSESNQSFICMLPDGTWIWCGKASTDTTWGCLVIVDELETEQPTTSHGPVGGSPIGPGGVATIGEYPILPVNQPSPPTLRLR